MFLLKIIKKIIAQTVANTMTVNGEQGQSVI